MNTPGWFVICSLFLEVGILLDSTKGYKVSYINVVYLDNTLRTVLNEQVKCLNDRWALIGIKCETKNAHLFAAYFCSRYRTIERIFFITSKYPVILGRSAFVLGGHRIKNIFKFRAGILASSSLFFTWLIIYEKSKSVDML